MKPERSYLSLFRWAASKVQPGLTNWDVLDTNTEDVRFFHLSEDPLPLFVYYGRYRFIEPQRYTSRSRT